MEKALYIVRETVTRIRDSSLESIQKRRHKNIRTYSTQSYKNSAQPRHEYTQRCEILKLTSLEERRIRGDLIQKFKIENKQDEIDWFFEPITGIAAAVIGVT